MSLKHIVQERVTVGGDTVYAGNTLESGSRVSIDEQIAVGTDTLVALTVDVSQVKSIFILSDRNITLETNNGGSPVNTLALKANIPYLWFTNKYDTMKFTSDITALYVTNASGGTARLQIEILVDPTV